ncbi:MAG TPA: sigma-70 family RNA polymerase sigma factor [Pyrinomonadaceae bacterium]|jgi:RNA polymerase sigma factor (TIGR02999 family)
MADPPTHEVTELLAAWSGGDEAALERLAPLVHAELHRLARRYMGRERAGHTLQTSALVNEAYVRLIKWKDARFENRAHFFGVSAQLMRRILVDFARSRPRDARGEPPQRLALDEALVVSAERDADLIALDEALEELSKLDPRKGRIVELRFFGGLSVEETAEYLNISGVTVMREWARAKAWLYRELNAAEGGDAR